MQIIDFYESKSRERWLSHLRLCDWKGGKKLCELIDKDKFHKVFGENAHLLLLTDGINVFSMCVVSDNDGKPDPKMSPWLGYVYTFPEHRGKHLLRHLFERAAELARKNGFGTIYLSTDLVGLYEKYGFQSAGVIRTEHGDYKRVYMKNTR